VSLVTLENISVQFPSNRRTLTAVDTVSLHIDPGETLALVGESGSGKSTIGNVIAGLQRPTAGTVRVHDQRAIQIIFQDPFGALDPRMPISSIIAEPLLIQRIGTRASRTSRVTNLLAQVGLPPDSLNRYPHEFSGGQRQRIAIARALAPNPELIVADEPLSALDVSIQSQILNLLAELQRARGLAYLFISHDLAVVNHLADRVAVMYLGHLVETGPRAELFNTPSHPYTVALLEAMPRIGRRRQRAAVIQGEMPSPLDPPPGCVFHTRCPKAQPICRTDQPRLEPAPDRPAQQAACHFKS
jgi:oligopeptide/dipeptide ABC transporter ATP-binding protein